MGCLQFEKEKVLGSFLVKDGFQVLLALRLQMVAMVGPHG